MEYIIIWLIVIGFAIFGQVQRQNRNARTGGGNSRQQTRPNVQNPVYRQSGYPGNAPGAAGNQRAGAPGQGGQAGYGAGVPGQSGRAGYGAGMPGQGGQAGYGAGMPGQGGQAGYGAGNAGQRSGQPGYGNGGADLRKQQELKDRLRQRYGSPQTARTAEAGQPGSRAGGAGRGNQPGAGSGGTGRGNQPGYGTAGAGRGSQPGYGTAGAGRGTASRAQGPQGKQGDILSRAAANVRENEADQLGLLMSVPGGLTGGLSGYDGFMGMADPGSSSELMRELSDLMIMGYQAEPLSTRDFVAEGVEMLGRYELS